MATKKDGKTNINTPEHLKLDSSEPVYEIKRTFDAPRELVFKAWAEPSQVMHWWGPKGFNIPVCEMDIRAGGAYRIVMNAPDGVNYPLKGHYREVLEPEKLVFTQNWEDHPEEWHDLLLRHGAFRTDQSALTTVTFDEREGKTLVSVRTLFESTEIRDAMIRIGMNEGWTESLDRLADMLRYRKGEALKATTSFTADPGKESVVISTLIDAPVDLVFKMYTDPRLIPHWWGPRRFTTTVDKMELKEGGVWRFMQREDDRKYEFHGIYHKVVKPYLIISTFEFGGEPGHVVLETVRFEDHEGRTKLTTTSVFQSTEDRLVMIGEGMEDGAVESMDRLAELVLKCKSEECPVPAGRAGR